MPMETGSLAPLAAGAFAMIAIGCLFGKVTCLMIASLLFASLILGT